MTLDERDGIISQYCNGIELTNQEILNALLVVKNDKGNEVIIDRNVHGDSANEYVALSAACELFQLEIEKENQDTSKYDIAIKQLTKYIEDKKAENDTEIVDSLEVALQALVRLSDLEAKIRRHRAIYSK